jgi:2-oxoglutarate ferredoxin oxidoreductase subunit gamma
MVERILIAGSGGQGIVLAGRLLADAALSRAAHITLFPDYGAEVRGGTSHCQIVLSSEEIPSPVCERFDAMLIMNQACGDLFLPRLEKTGLAIVNESLCRPPACPHAALRATEMAERLGDIRVANLIMLGAYVAHRRIVSAGDVEAAISRIIGTKHQTLVELNLRALRAGLKPDKKS